MPDQPLPVPCPGCPVPQRSAPPHPSPQPPFAPAKVSQTVTLAAVNFRCSHCWLRAFPRDHPLPMLHPLPPPPPGLPPCHPSLLWLLLACCSPAPGCFFCGPSMLSQANVPLIASPPPPLACSHAVVPFFLRICCYLASPSPFPALTQSAADPSDQSPRRCCCAAYTCALLLLSHALLLWCSYTLMMLLLCTHSAAMQHERMGATHVAAATAAAAAAAALACVQ